MKKSCVITILLLVFFCTALCSGCSKKKVEGYNPPMSELTWGMTRKDCMESLGDKSYELLDLEDGVHSSIVLEEKLNRFGNEAKVYLLFSIEMCADPSCGGRLKAVILRYDTTDKEQLIGSLKTELGDEYTERDNVFQSSSLVWSSEDRLKDIEEGHLNKIKKFLEDSGGTSVLSSMEASDTVEDTLNETPVNVITLHEISEDQASAFVVTYYGDWAYIDQVMVQESLVK